MREKYINFLFSYPKLMLIALVILTGFACFSLSKLPVETSVESLIMDNDPDLLFYNSYKEQFGEDEFVVMAFSANDIFTPELLGEIDELTQTLEEIDEIKEVISITNVESILGTENDFYVRPLCEEMPETLDQAREVKKLAFSLASVKGNIVSQDGKSSLFLIRTVAHEGDETYDLRLLNNIRQAVEKNTKKGSFLSLDKLHTAGWLVTDVNMSSHINRDNQIFIPSLYIALCVFLFFTLRSALGVVIGLFNITFCLVWTMAGLYLSGGAISPMTAILTPLILALSVSDSVHLLLHFLKKKRSREQILSQLKETMNDLWRPCFLTSVTTAIGFLSLLVSDIPPIRQFGLAAALGMMAEFFLTMTLIPLMIYFLRNTSMMVKDYKIQATYLSKLSGKIPAFLEKNSRVVLIGSALLIIGSIYGVFQINVETNLIEYFKKDSAVYQDFSFIDTNLNGVNTIEISVRETNGQNLLAPEYLNKINKIETYLKELPIVGTTTSVNTFIKQMHKSFHAEDQNYYTVPESKEMIAQYLFIYGGDEIYNFLNENRDWTRISARVSEHSSKKLEASIQQINRFIKNEIKEPGLEIKVTGKTFLVTKLVKNIVNSQVYSLMLAFAIIFVILFIVFRSFKLGLLSIIPNFLPILFNLGLMGVLSIPLNTATSIISAVAIGIAVDDTIHFLTAYQLERRKGTKMNKSALAAVSIKGEPIIVTSLILCCGFGIMIFSSFVPTIQFGLLSAGIMISAMMCDLFILPASMVVFQTSSKPKGR